MKTNHKRGFVAKNHRDKAMNSWGDCSLFSDKIFGAGISNDFCNGNRGMAKAVKGAKKFVRSRIRAADKMKTNQLMKEI